MAPVFLVGFIDILTSCVAPQEAQVKWDFFGTLALSGANVTFVSGQVTWSGNLPRTSSRRILEALSMVLRAAAKFCVAAPQPLGMDQKAQFDLFGLAVGGGPKGSVPALGAGGLPVFVHYCEWGLVRRNEQGRGGRHAGGLFF